MGILIIFVVTLALILVSLYRNCFSKQASVAQLLIEQATSQAGSLVAFDRLRFDFNFDRPLLENEVMEIENVINRWIGDATLLQTKVMPIVDAKRAGAIAMFGQKYGDQVKAEEVTTRVDALLEELRMTKMEVSEVRRKAAVDKAAVISSKAFTVGTSKKIRVLVECMDDVDADSLKSAAEYVVDKLQDQ